MKGPDLLSRLAILLTGSSCLETSAIRPANMLPSHHISSCYPLAPKRNSFWLAKGIPFSRAIINLDWALSSSSSAFGCETTAKFALSQRVNKAESAMEMHQSIIFDWGRHCPSTPCFRVVQKPRSTKYADRFGKRLTRPQVERL